jgi:hypothetical protein
LVPKHNNDLQHSLQTALSSKHSTSSNLNLTLLTSHSNTPSSHPTSLSFPTKPHPQLFSNRSSYLLGMKLSGNKKHWTEFKFTFLGFSRFFFRTTEKEQIRTISQP